MQEVCHYHLLEKPRIEIGRKSLEPLFASFSSNRFYAILYNNSCWNAIMIVFFLHTLCVFRFHFIIGRKIHENVFHLQHITPIVSKQDVLNSQVLASMESMLWLRRICVADSQLMRQLFCQETDFRQEKYLLNQTDQKYDND